MPSEPTIPGPSVEHDARCLSPLSFLPRFFLVCELGLRSPTERDRAYAELKRSSSLNRTVVGTVAGIRSSTAGVKLLLPDTQRTKTTFNERCRAWNNKMG